MSIPFLSRRNHDKIFAEVHRVMQTYPEGTPVHLGVLFSDPGLKIQQKKVIAALDSEGLLLPEKGERPVEVSEIFNPLETLVVDRAGLATLIPTAAQVLVK
ncbi:MAG: hypothetical protein EBR02_09115 [Alphaproteobacteria bacterium]|nr:hypothetical protein [Alphaproteobacteria bacterium]